VLPTRCTRRSQARAHHARLNARNAKLAFDGTGTDLLSVNALDGTLALSGTSLAAVGDAVGVTLPTTAPFSLKGRLAKAADRWSLKGIDLASARAAWAASSASTAPRGRRSDWRVDRLALRARRPVPAFGAPVHGAPNPKPAGGRVPAAARIRHPVAEGDERERQGAPRACGPGSLFRQPLEPLQGDLSLTGGVLKLSNGVARTSGGELKGGVGSTPTRTTRCGAPTCAGPASSSTSSCGLATR
jgi:hypothetical protein